MGAVADQLAAAGLVPLAGHGGAGALQAHKALEEENLALLGPDQLGGLLDGGGIDKVLRVHELLACIRKRLNCWGK